MRKLLLASTAKETLQFLEPLLDKPVDQCVLMFIPNAADLYDDKWFVAADWEALEEMGFTLYELNLRDASYEDLVDMLAKTDIVFVAGGNTFYLLEAIRQSGFDDAVIDAVERGVVYVGSSAGSIVAGPTIEPIQGYDEEAGVDLDSYDGLALVDFVVLPHDKPGEYDRVLEAFDGSGLEFIRLTDEQAVIVEGENYKIVDTRI